MSIQNKFNLVLSNKVQNNISDKTLYSQSYYRKNLNQTDTFESSTKKNQISFKGAQQIQSELLKKATQSKTFWTTLGGTVLTTALAVWAKITNNGEQESNLSQEEIEKLIYENMGIENPNQSLNTDSENVIDIEPKETISTEIQTEAPKKRRGRPPKNLKLDEGKQPDTNNAVKKIRRQQANDVELIKSLAEQGLTVSQIEAKTGIKAQQIKRLATKENITLVDARKIKRKELSETTLETTTEISTETSKKNRGLTILNNDEISHIKDVMNSRKQKNKEIATIKDLAKQGLSATEISRQTNIDVKKVRRIAEKANIELADARKKTKRTENTINNNFNNENKINAQEESSKTEEKQIAVTELTKSNKQIKTSITEEIIEQVLNLFEQKIPQQDIAKKIGISDASVSRIVSGKFLLGKSAPVKSLRNLFEKELNYIINSFKDSPETLFEKQVARSYRLYLSQLGQDKFLEFATTKKNSSLLSEKSSFTSIIECQKEVIPKNDSIFEDYKKCFNKEQFIAKYTELRKEFIENLLTEIVQRKEFYEFKSLDNTEDITLEGLLDILCNVKITKALEKQENIYNNPSLEKTDFSVEEISEKEAYTNSVNISKPETSLSTPQVPVVNNIAELGDEGYIKFLQGEITCEEPHKNFALKRYKDYLGKKEEISIENAVEALKKIDKYLSLAEEEKNRIENITNIFNNKKSKFEKKILKEIIDTEYMTKNTKIYNSFYGEDVVITAKVKKDIKNSKNDSYINILKAFESAAALHSKKINVPGITEYFSDYSMEIRLSGNFGGMRLFSSKLCKDKNGNEIKNFVFDHFAPDH